MSEVLVVGPIPDPVLERAKQSPLLPMVGQHFHLTGAWPTGTSLQRRIVREGLGWDVYQQLTVVGMTYARSIMPGDFVGLTVQGMAISGECQEELECLARVVPLFVAAYADTDDDLPNTLVTLTHVQQQLQLDEGMVAKLPKLMEGLSVLAYGFGDHDGELGWLVSGAAYRFADVRTSANLVAVAEAIDRPRTVDTRPPLFDLGGPGAPGRTVALTLAGLHPAIAEAAAADFVTRPHVAVSEAWAVVRSALRNKSDCQLDGTGLVDHAFKQLAFGDLTTETGQSQQAGARMLALGVAQLIRNPYVHDRPETEQAELLEALATISLLLRYVERAVSRRPTLDD